MRAATTTPTMRERLTLSVLLTASFTLAVDFSILNVALPDVGADVGFSLQNLQWIATSFALCAAGLTLLFGRVADLFGRRRLFLAGIALLGLSSLVGGLATEPWVLLVARVAQGTAAAVVTPCRAVVADDVLPRGATTGACARAERRADGGRLHDRRRARRRAHRPAQLALGVLRQRRRRARRTGGRPGGADREPARPSGPGSTCAVR